jgi:hypothetical protein
MATDRDEQQRDQQRQAQELEEIRRSFAEMGARMGSLFEPSEAEAGEPERPQQAALPPPPSTQAPGVFEARPRWWWAGALVLLFVAGTAFGWILPKGGDDPEATTQPSTATTAPPATTVTTARPLTVPSVPEACLDAAQLANEIISKLNRNDRDNRLALALRDWSVANQDCRREASP